jgi:hypothetical protein
MQEAERTESRRRPQKPLGFVRRVNYGSSQDMLEQESSRQRTLVHLGTLWMPLRYPRSCLLNTVYLSLAGISCSLGSSRA